MQPKNTLFVCFVVFAAVAELKDLKTELVGRFWRVAREAARCRSAAADMGFKNDHDAFVDF